MSGPHIPAARFGAREAQPIDGMIPDARKAFEDLFPKSDPNDLPLSARIAAERRQRVLSIAARKFADADGQELLEALADHSVRRPVMVVVPGVTLDSAALYAAKREGQNDLFFVLLAWIAEGRSEQTPQREGSGT